MEYFLFFGFYPNKIIRFLREIFFGQGGKRKMFGNSSAIVTLISYKKPARTFLIAALLTLSAGSVYSQPEPVLPPGLVGIWEGDGLLFGQPATFTMEWAHSLEGKFMTFGFRNNFTDGSGTTRTMEARAYYQLQSHKGYWFDSRGQMLPLTYEVVNNALTVFWGEAGTERGRTSYTIAAGKAEVIDEVYRDKTYVVFGTASYQKIE
jgi:hypothetical protein